MDWIRSTLSLSSADLAALSLPVGVDRTCTGFQCANGKCVYSFYRCDGGWDCDLDGSDELYCSHDSAIEEQPTTKSSVAATGSGSAALSKPHCGDEENDGFLCSDGVTCLPYYQRCDYILDCPGGEDERNCFCKFFLLRYHSIELTLRFLDCLESDIPCDDNRRCLPFSIALTSISNDTFGRWIRDRFDCKGSKWFFEGPQVVSDVYNQYMAVTTWYCFHVRLL